MSKVIVFTAMAYKNVTHKIIVLENYSDSPANLFSLFQASYMTPPFYFRCYIGANEEVKNYGESIGYCLNLHLRLPKVVLATSR